MSRIVPCDDCDGSGKRDVLYSQMRLGPSVPESMAGEVHHQEDCPHCTDGNVDLDEREEHTNA